MIPAIVLNYIISITAVITVSALMTLYSPVFKYLIVKKIQFILFLAVTTLKASETAVVMYIFLNTCVNRLPKSEI